MVDPAQLERMLANEADMAFRRRVATMFEWLRPDPGDRILDAGCGRGFYLNFLRHAGCERLAGVELDLGVAARARAALGDGPGPAVVAATLDRLPFGAGVFDKAIVSEVLEHVADDAGVLREVARTVRPGGLVAITVPNADYPFWWDPLNKSLEALLGTHVARGPLAGIWANHVRLYHREQLRELVAAAGLELVAERSFTHHCFAFQHNLVYGLGKPLLERGLLPAAVAAAADRYAVDGRRGGALNLVNLALRVFERCDRRNRMDEPEGRTTVNLCALARAPLADLRRARPGRREQRPGRPTA